MIEFQLTDLSKLSEFRNAYESAGLPKMGPNIDYFLFKTLGAITDGIVAAVIILVSLLLNLIAMLCIRFTILAVVEEDYREIGVMKAIGIRQQDIKKLYLFKYILMAAIASTVGYAASLLLNPLFTSNMMLYIGTAPKSIVLHLTPLLAVILIFLFIVCFCMYILRRFSRISAVEALRSGNIGEMRMGRKYRPLSRSKWLNVSISLGLRDVFGRFKIYRLLLFVVIVCSFMMIVPLHFLNTIQSPDFIKYMGVERSDLRIDVQQSNMESFNEMITFIKNDPDVARFSPKVISQFKVINEDGVPENITVETGDFSIFPLEYLKGVAPHYANEIALSYLNGKELQKSVGDSVKLIVKGQEKAMVISGIYQDVTNGGRTAKALLPFNPETVLRYEISLDLKSHVNINEKMDHYAQIFDPAKVTDLKGYLAQTFGNTIEQLRLFTIIAFVIALSVAILITSLFLKMVVARDDTQIAIMKSIGFSLNNIRAQYIIRALLVLGIGIVLGALISNTFGQSLVSVLMSLMGAASIKFVIDPLQAFVLCPLILMAVVMIATLMSTISIEKSSIAGMNGE